MDVVEEKKCKVQFNYHIMIQSKYYSVPYQYYKSIVDVKITVATIEIYNKNELVAKHERLYNMNKYSTIANHMPPVDYKKTDWNGERFRDWASSIGTSVLIVVDKILKSYPYEQQSYKTVLSLLTLTKKYSKTKLESACSEALIHYSIPRYTSIKNILDNK